MTGGQAQVASQARAAVVDPMDPIPLNAIQSDEHSLDLELLSLLEDDELFLDLDEETDPLLCLPMVPVH